ncbi:hypothetical protein [Pseudomonas putida]|uniref:Uncharacterized protein n=1 Tax=Pseudomonas putida TaxID=303 RepID=A0A1X1A464_PSEPU|nr:hypothetical protein [Pseudomonas putida]ORL66645.1 hypothetical protein B7H17_05030 [Pseudomonas putida]
MDTNKMREQFEAYRDKRNAELEAEGHKPGSRWHISNAHYPTWEASRDAVVVELPAKAEPFEAELSATPIYTLKGEGRNAAIAECRAAIEAQGLKVAP